MTAATPLSGRTPVIHIGMPKTATKTLQWQLFSQHSELFYLGRYDGYVFSNKYSKMECCRNEDVHSLMRQIAYGNVHSPDLPHCRELLKKIVAPAIERNLVPVWSWESYSTDVLAKRRIRARNLREVFGDAKILMSLRHPLTLLESAYFQQLKRDNVGPGGRRGRPLYYLPIDKWLKKNFFGEVLPHLEYAETIRAYTDQFGVENVHVFLYEHLKAEGPDVFFGEICDVMGIGKEEGIGLVQGKTANMRWTTRQVELLQQITASPVRSLAFRFGSKDKRKQMLGLAEEAVSVASGQKARAEISDAWKRKIFDTVETGNLWLEDTYGLPLRAYDYYGREKP